MRPVNTNCRPDGFDVTLNIEFDSVVGDYMDVQCCKVQEKR